MAPPFKHADNVLSAEFSPDDAWVVTVCADKTVRVWDAETGQPLTPPLSTSSNVRRAWFSPDGKRILTATVGGMVCSWNLLSESRSTEDWRLLSRILSGHRIDENTGLVSMEPQEFRREWETFAKRWPLSERMAPPDDEQAWLRERDAGRKP
jgi:WD40 repeat protein